MRRGGELLFLGILLLGMITQTNCGGSGGNGTAPSLPAGTIVSKTAGLSGGEAVPPVATSASGSGLLEVNTATGAVSGRLTIATAPTSTIIAAHVHEGARGVNGSIVIVLENAGSGVWSVPTGKTLTPAQISTFSAGGFYFNVHTDAHPNGEIRGQIDGQ
jgi:CHRD domain-containing protein